MRKTRYFRLQKSSHAESIREGTDIVWHGGLQIPTPFNTLDLGSYKGLVFENLIKFLPTIGRQIAMPIDQLVGCAGDGGSRRDRTAIQGSDYA